MARILSQEEIDAQFRGGFRAEIAPAGLGTRFGAAIDRSQAGLLGIGEAAGLPLGDLRRQNQFEQEQSMQRYFGDNPNEPQSYKDVEGVGSALRYARGLAIDSSPELITSLATGGAGALMGLGTAGRIGLAAAANYPSAVGDILQNQRQEAGQTALGVAGLLGVPYAAADLVGLDAALASGKMMRTGIKRLDEMQGVRGGLARTGANVAMNAPIEGASETFQELVNQTGRMAVNPNQTLFNPEANERYLESFVGGAALGGTASGLMGGWRRSEQYQTPEQETDLLNKQTQQTQKLAPQQYGLVTQPAPLQQRIDQQLGIGVRTTPKDYAKQFAAAYDEPSGQYSTDPVTGLEKQLSVGEYQQLTGASLDLTESKPAEAAAATAAIAKIERDPKDLFIRDTLKVIPNQYSRQLFDIMAESGVDPQSDLMAPIWNYAAQKYMGKGRYEKAVQLMDEAIINARKGAPSGIPTSTGLGTAGGMGVGGAVVPGAVGTAGSASPVQGTVGGTTAGTGAPLQQAGVLPDTSGQPSTTVTTAPTDLTTPPASTSKFKRAPKPMTVLEAAEAAKGQQTGTRNQAALARGEVTPDVVSKLSDDQLATELTNVNISDAEYTLLQQEQAQRSQKDAINKPDIISQIFGEQDAGIVRDFLMGKSSAKIAAELKTAGVQGRGEQMIRNKIAGEKAVREEWPKKIAAAKAKYGYTDQQIQQAIKASLAPDADTRSEIERELNLGRADIYGVRLSETEAAEAGLEGSVKSAGGGSSAVKGFTKLQKNIDAMYKRLETEKEPLVLAYISNRLTELQKQVEIFEDKEQAKIRETAGLGDTDGEVDLVAAAQEAEPESSSINNADEAKKAAAEKLRAEAAAKRVVDRKGLAVGDTVVNTKLGTGVVKSFSGDGNATLVTVDFQSGQTKELSVQMAKLEKTNAVQVTSTAVVPVQPKTEAGKGVGGQVRRTEKPASKGQTQGQAKEQIDRGKALWESLSAKTPGLVPYEQLNKLEQDYLTDLAVRTNGKPVVAKEMGLQQLLTKEPVTIDVESRIIDEQVTTQVAALPAPQVERLEKHYGVKSDTAEFLEKVQADITKYVTQGAEAVAGAIRSIIKAMAEGVLAMGIVFNPNITKDAFTLNVAKTFEQTIEVTQAVPAVAKAQMSPTAQAVYEAMAPVAMKSGKWFMVADKPNGMLHIFKEDGSHALSDPTLYGKDTGDVLAAVSSLEGGAKVTPAGTFTLKARPSTYAGGQELILVESKDYTGYIAIHAADTSTPSENRLGRLDTPTAADNRVSYGCINTKHDTFINEIAPNIANLDGGMVFVVPDAQEQAAQMFAAETRTETRTEGGQGAKGVAAASVVGKEENMLFGKDRVASQPYTAAELTADIQGFIRADVTDRKLIIVDSIEDLLNSGTPLEQRLGAAIDKKGAYGVAANGVAYLVANRIQKGQGRAKFMHEVGAHLGLETLLPKVVYNRLVDQLEKWAESGKDSLEAKLAAKAKSRVGYAKTPTADEREELLAYFVEEAMLAGIDPTAMAKESGPLLAWFRTLWAAFKIAVRKLGFKPEALSAEDVVNLAFGAARLEMNGSWHGTAATFRRFNHAFMSSGEGAQAYGWGTYLAQAVGIGRAYWQSDVERKLQDRLPKAFFDGRPIEEVEAELQAKDINYRKTAEETYLLSVIWEISHHLKQGDVDAVRTANRAIAKLGGPSNPVFAKRFKPVSDWLDKNTRRFEVKGSPAPDGNLMRLDTAVSDNDTLDWDASFADQPEVVRDFVKGEAATIKDLNDNKGANIRIKTGEDIYKYLVARFWNESKGTGSWKDASSEARTAIKKQASKYLESKGIQGIRFYDADSRENTINNMSFTKGGKTIRGREGVLKAYFTPGEIVFGNGYADKVVDFNYDPQNYLVSVRVVAVDGDGNPRRDSRVRVHSTMPTASDVAMVMRSRGYEVGEANRTRNLVIFNEKNIFRVGSAAAADDQRMKFGVNAPNQGTIQRNISKLPRAAQQPARLSLGAIGDAVNKGLDYVVFTSDLVDRATKSGVSSAKKFVDLVGKSKSEARENEIAVEKISDMYALVPEKDRGTGDGSVNRFLFDSTREGKWGYGKYRNDDMGARFDALAPESQAYVEAVFAHGSDMLAKKKKLVLDSTNSEYDAMIAAAKADGDTANEVKLTKEKEATLKRFQTLFKIRDGIPYAPIKRNGSHVVIAKSKEYLDAEAANDKKKIAELESNSDHYHVSFTDGKWEARTLQQDLNDQGFFDDVQIAERDTVIDEMFSGHSALRELTKMRSRVDAQAKDGDKSSSKMLSLISQMYLEALAEDSARKSEMRRRGVAGEVDMIRSFAQQGRADANFMASIKYNPQVQDALQEMRNQVKKGDRERKSEIFNELAKRYVQSLDYVERPWLNKLTRMSSLYFLATSPAYYLQNLTQPWMMSVPAMAGKHNYSQASTALFKAYTELGGVMKSAKLLKQQFDFNKVPSDVRDAIKELVNRGKIDIGLDTEMGEFKVEGDGYFAGKISAADKALRLAVQKVESINRLSTAMAAYRLELAKTGNKQDAINYADRILTETHGDYTSFNAPRAFNTGVGKVALQFRKFQLIQLSFYAKLIKDALQGADRAAALKTLAYSLGHTGLLAGAMGMPGYAAIAWAINALLGDEDEPYDITNEIRKAIGDEQVANLILRGAPTLVGADISGKVGAGNMLSIMPFSQADLSTTAGRAEAFGTLIGGASLGMVSRMIDGLGLMMSGDWHRGLEQTMPKGVSDAMKAYRIANEGMTRRNGDIILPPDEVSAMDTLFQAIGVQPVKQTVTYERQTLMKETTQNFTERTTKIKNDYVKAARNGDSEAQGEAREAWKALQEAKKRNGVNTTPLSELLKAPAEQKKREKMTVGGVQYTKGTRKLAEEIAGE